MSWSHAEAMQGWEAAEERESWARCDAEKWKELARELAEEMVAAFYIPISCDVCAYRKHEPCPKDELGLCRAEAHYPILVAIARARKAGLEV